MIYEINCGTFDAENLKLDKNELASRLCIPKGYPADFADRCDALVKNAMNVRYCCIKVPVKIHGCKVNLEFAEFESASLTKNLEGCDFAYIFAITLGIAVDRLITRLAITSSAESFIADGIASAYAEAAADKLSELLSASAALKPRFSPGYGDLPLSVQPEILGVLKAEKLAGITLNDSLLMTPFKSVTAIQGIKNN